MFTRKRFLLLGSSLLIAALVYTFSPMRAGTALAYTEPCPPTINSGSTGAWVQVLQTTLNGFWAHFVVSFPNYPLAIDGDFGPKTATAVHDFQTSVMKIQPGAVGASTWADLGYCGDPFSGGPSYVLSNSGGGTICPGLLSEGSSGTWVRALQQALNKDAVAGAIPFAYNGVAWWPLALDGSFGPLTKAAVISFQDGNNLTQDGIVGNQTWGAMGLCYYPI